MTYTWIDLPVKALVLSKADIDKWKIVTLAAINGLQSAIISAEYSKKTLDQNDNDLYGDDYNLDLNDHSKLIKSLQEVSLLIGLLHQNDNNSEKSDTELINLLLDQDLDKEISMKLGITAYNKLGLKNSFIFPEIKNTQSLQIYRELSRLKCIDDCDEPEPDLPPPPEIIDYNS
jgi:hypothetical protein